MAIGNVVANQDGLALNVKPLSARKKQPNVVAMEQESVANANVIGEQSSNTTQSMAIIVLSIANMKDSMNWLNLHVFVDKDFLDPFVNLTIDDLPHRRPPLADDRKKNPQADKRCCM